MYKKIVFVGALLVGMSAGAMELTVTPEVDDKVVIYIGEEEHEVTLPKKYAELMGILELVDDPAFVAKFRFQEITFQGWKFIAGHLERMYEITHNSAIADRLRQEIFAALNELEDKYLIEVIGAADYLQIPLLLEIAFNGIDQYRCTLLLRAAQKGRFEVVELLVGRPEVEVNAVVEINRPTPLHWAAQEGHVEVVKLLLGRDDIKVNATDLCGSTPLHLAVQKGHQEIVKLLLRRDDIEVNAADLCGSTPLHWAVHHLEVLKLLLDRPDIEVNAANNSDCTPIHLATQNGQPEVVKLLLGRGDIKVNLAVYGSTSLRVAAYYGHIEIVKLLLGRDDIEVNAATTDGETPLYCAVEKGHVEVVKLLLNRDDIKVNIAGSHGDTPLHLAVQNRHPEVVKLLLGREDIEINAANNFGVTPLNSAAEKGHVEVVKLLLDRDDIEVNATTRNRIPLYLAARSGHRDVCLCLLRYGLIRPENRTRGAQAILTEYTSLLNYIHSKLANDNPVRALFSENNRGNILEMLEQGLADIEMSKH